MAAPRRGEVWWADLGSPSRVSRHEQAKRRPIVILSADFVNESAADLVIVAPLTTGPRRARSHVSVQPPEGGLPTENTIQCEQIRAISRDRLEDRLGHLDRDTLDEISRILMLILDLP